MTTHHDHTHSGAPRRFAGGAPLRLGALAVLTALVLLLPAAPALAATTETKFTITGRGWGHGIGMSQWGAYGYAKNGWSYKAILKHYYKGISFGTKSNGSIRVMLRSGLKSMKLKCAASYTATSGTATMKIPAGTTATTTRVSNGFRVVAGTASRTFSSNVTFRPSRGSLNVLTKTDMGDTGLYRGTIRAVASGSTLRMINVLPLESYLRGVVPREVSPSWPAESLKAQACAARAYAARSLKPSASFDVYCDTRSQVYTGADREDRRTNQALTDTAGVVPTYGGRIITAYYFSSSGGRTENIEYGWPGASPVGYLKGVRDQYDTYAPRHRWGPLSRTRASITSSLGSAVRGVLRTVYVVKRGTSPRIVKAAVVGSGGVTYIDGNKLRMRLGLNSTWATIRSVSISPAPKDAVTVAAGTRVTLKGRTYPGLAAGAAVKLRSYYNGAWHTRTVESTRRSAPLAGGHTAYYSTYKATVTVRQTSKYYWIIGKAASPTTTITVK